MHRTIKVGTLRGVLKDADVDPKISDGITWLIPPL